jgi:hypothetical protein
VIVMRLLVGELVAGETVAEPVLVNDAAVGQHLHGSVNGGVADVRIDASHHLEQLLDADMVRALKKCIDNETALFGRAQSLPIHVRFEIAP